MKKYEDVVMSATYGGYKSTNLENFNVNELLNLKSIIFSCLKNTEYDNLEKRMNELDKISLNDVKSISKNFLTSYFNIDDIAYCDTDLLSKYIPSISQSENPSEFYDKINSILKNVSPFDLDTNLVNGNSMAGKVVKPLLITPDFIDSPKRKVYFSHIELGRNLTILSSCAYSHELTHLVQEKNIGYADDYLLRELISIFMEKLNAYMLDKTGNLLKIAEQTRFNDIFCKYLQLINPKYNLNNNQKIECLMYIKSGLYAEKLFDMYLSEIRQKDRDKYIDDIQKVFDGRIKVDELIKKRHINIQNSEDIMLLKKHI